MVIECSNRLLKKPFNSLLAYGAVLFAQGAGDAK
jgi:hypothetical protein